MSHPGKRFHPAVWAGVALAALLVTATDTREPEPPRQPALWLWAWERADDLSFLDPKTTGVAYLAATVTITPEHVSWNGRRQALRLPPGTRRIAVIRIEDRERRLDDATRHELVSRLASEAHASGAVGLQLDWDAPLSLRPAYRLLLADVRAALPDTIPLSMTALASWCVGDCWLGNASVDEIVPMVFRMGADERRVRYDLARLGDFPCHECRRAVGLSTDEAWPALPTRRVYLFHAGAWNAEIVRRAVNRLEGSRRDGR